jgi:hypothetical protein
MTLCVGGLPGGVNVNCLSYPSPVTNIIITDSAESFTQAEIKLRAEWKERIQEDLTVWVPSGLSGYENTTDDPTINTTGLGHKVNVRTGVPSGVFYLRSNFCDFNEVMRTLKGGTQRIFFIHADGMISGIKDRNDGAEIKGFQAELMATTKGFAPADTIENAFPVYINFMEYSEFENQYAFLPEWNASLELPTFMPMSYAMWLISADTATDTAVVDVFERCGDAVADLDTTEFEVVESTLTDDAILSVTDNGGGNYDVVFTDTAAGEYAVLRVKALTSTVVDALSNTIYIEF